MKWTEEKNEELRRRYPHEHNSLLAEEFGCSRKALAFRAHQLRITKTEKYNEARYASMTKKAPEALTEGVRRAIATGTVIVRGNILTHISHASALGEA